ncbi:hypothetical protein EYF80_053629 [Liparis tanakae]|uniref:Uncharacterized protein n=1 Tax=Liparis tanakae TaxID=230148 RepID=A0A4Z2F5M8_9TELE|nr:hypothetical protein EYF80_053629 [Liparis tanakae]
MSEGGPVGDGGGPVSGRPGPGSDQLDMQNDWNRQTDGDRQSQSASPQKDEPRSDSQEAERERVHSGPDKGSDVMGRDWPP